MNRITEPDETELAFSRLFPKIVLASRSENRRKLIECGGSTVYQLPMETKEERKGKTAEETVLNIARAKMEAYLTSDKKIPTLPALTADTLVLFSGSLIGKAGTEKEAKERIKSFSGKKQSVITASLLYLPDDGISEIVDTADVWFKKLSDEEIDAYIATGDWIEAAGSYRLQRNGWSIVERIDGDWTTVVGLPMKKIIESMNGKSIEPFS